MPKAFALQDAQKKDLIKTGHNVFCNSVNIGFPKLMCECTIATLFSADIDTKVIFQATKMEIIEVLLRSKLR